MAIDVADFTTATSLPQKVIGTISIGAGLNSPVNTFSIDRGTQCVGYLFDFNGTNAAPQQIQITGHQTQNLYLNALTPNVLAGINWVEIADQDTSVDCQVLAAASFPSKVYFVSTPLIAAVQVRNVAGQTVAVKASNTPALWQAATLIKAFSINLASTGVQHIIAGTPNQTIYLRRIFVSVSAAGAFAGTWQDTGGTSIGSDTFQNGAPRTLPYDGAPLPGGNGVGLDFNVTANGSSFLGGYVAYNLG